MIKSCSRRCWCTLRNANVCGPRPRNPNTSIAIFSTANMDDSTLNYSYFMNRISSARKPSPIRELTSLMSTAPPSVIFLAGGLPNPELFPFKTAKVTLQNGAVIDISGSLMIKALQYGPTPGYPDLVQQLRDLVKQYHNPPTFPKLDLLVTTGSQDGMCRAMEMIMNIGDYVIIQEPTYPGTLGILNPYSPKYLIVDGDADGMCPKSLRNVLLPWSVHERRNKESLRPKMIYINPNGANPAGTTLSLTRRKEIYKIAQEYNLLILEDDPYYFLQFSDSLLPSFLSMDIDGRVLRFDSFSKVLSAGMRVGFVTGPKPLLDRIAYHIQASSLHSSSLSQVLISELLKLWGEDGFSQHIMSVKSFYGDQKDLAVKYAKKWLTGLAEWEEPKAGMFLWIKVLGIADTYSMIMDKAIKREVVLVPGKQFLTNQTKESPYLRAAFSMATEEMLDKGFSNLAALIEEEQALEKKRSSI